MQKKDAKKAHGVYYIVIPIKVVKDLYYGYVKRHGSRDINKMKPDEFEEILQSQRAVGLMENAVVNGRWLDGRVVQGHAGLRNFIKNANSLHKLKSMLCCNSLSQVMIT